MIKKSLPCPGWECSQNTFRPRILVAGLGNIFFGDDAFGVAVAQRLAKRPPIAGVHIRDFGIRGLDLAYALLDGYDVVILVDACPRGETPGSLVVIEPKMPSTEGATDEQLLLDSHVMNRLKVLSQAVSMGASWSRLFLVGCEPHDLEADFLPDGMSPEVAQAVDQAIILIDELIARLRNERTPSVFAAG